MFKKITLMFIYFWDRERERETECQAGTRFWTVSTEPHMGLELKNCKIISQSQRRSPKVPKIEFFLGLFIYLFWERERVHENVCELGRGRERGRERISSRLCVCVCVCVCQHRAGHRARTHRPWDHDLVNVGPSTNWATQGLLSLYSLTTFWNKHYQ